ncbi:hypothetical protein EAG_07014 [Camponotus floridanus]|uniref:Uncharacterized protein n=1 Tax=Camponotus floridanus TaxID=104421 RepID=E2AA12_CAMFO|nr:hypothetical protein EAG_07014 [Camponotus floridanus]
MVGATNATSYRQAPSVSQSLLDFSHTPAGLSISCMANIIARARKRVSGKGALIGNGDNAFAERSSSINIFPCLVSTVPGDTAFYFFSCHDPDALTQREDDGARVNVAGVDPTNSPTQFATLCRTPAKLRRFLLLESRYDVRQPASQRNSALISP